ESCCLSEISTLPPEGKRCSNRKVTTEHCLRDQRYLQHSGELHSASNMMLCITSGPQQWTQLT
ncbi:hypothetical protein STEG23_016636, partial [Scotinomys teguina]